MANIPGKVHSINGHALEVGAFAGVEGLVVESSADAMAEPQYLDGGGQPPDFSQSSIKAQAIDVSFKVLDYPAKTALLAAIDYPNIEDTIELQSYHGDPAAPTLCTSDVAIRNIAISAGDVLARFDKADTAWRALALSDLGRTLSFGSSAAATLINQGHVRSAPYFKLGWTVQRASFSSAVGWRFRRQVTITNDSPNHWTDELITVDAGDTAAWVTATEALTNGDDVRVWFEGKERYRTLTCFNAKRTFIHFLVTLRSGESAVFDVVYGNSAANTPRDLSTYAGTRQTYAAPDLEGHAGLATAGSTSTITQSSATWETNRWRGGWIGFLTGPQGVRWRRIASNTGTVITFNRVLGTAPDSTTQFVVFMSGILFDGGRITGGISSVKFDDNLHTRPWGINSLVGATVTFIAGSTASPSTMIVESNTPASMNFTTAFSVNPTVNDQYIIQRQGIWTYLVDRSIQESDHRGTARANKHNTQPTRIWPNGDTPAGWQIETYLPNDDDYGVYPAWDAGSGGGHTHNYWLLPQSNRRGKQDGEIIGEGSGDGWSLYTGFALQGWYLDYDLQNRNGVCQAVFSAMDVGGQDWQDMVVDATTYASITNVAAQHIDLSDFGNPTRLYMGLLPADGVEIPPSYSGDGAVSSRTASTVTDSSQAWATNYWKNGRVTFPAGSGAAPASMPIISNTGTVLTLLGAFTTQPAVNDTFLLSRPVLPTDIARLRSGDFLEVYHYLPSFGDLTSSIYTIGSKVECFEAACSIRIGGGRDAERVGPFDEIVIGGAGHRIMLPANYELWIATNPTSDAPLFGVYNSTYVLQYAAAWAGVIKRYAKGSTTGVQSREFTPIPPAINMITNGYFGTNASDWDTPTKTVGVTLAGGSPSRVATPDAGDGVGTGSLEIDITAAPVGAWTISIPWIHDSTLTAPDKYAIPVAPGKNYPVGFAYRAANIGSSLSVQLKAVWEGGVSDDPDTLLGGAPAAIDTWYYDAEDEITFYVAPGLVSAFQNTEEAMVTIELSGTGSYVGKVYIDQVTLGVPNVHVTQIEAGTMTLKVSFQEGFLS